MMHEECGVIGMYGVGNEAARLAVPALWALQHRGQESSGISVSNLESIHTHKGMGLVARVFNEENIDALHGSIAIGHNRYSTDKASTIDHAQPVIRDDELVALAHNGNLPVTEKLEAFLSSQNIPTSESNDSEMMADAIRSFLHKGADLPHAVSDSFPLFTGAFSLVVMTKDKLVAVRDQYGIHPLSIGKLNGGYVFASETCAFNPIQATLLRDVRPGEMVVIDENGLTSIELAKSKQKLDIFEFVYTARPDSMLLGRPVNEVRYNFGINLGKEHPVKADIVIPVPLTAIPAAEGYSFQTGIPMREGFAKNSYIHRTFIQPSQKQRENEVRLKLSPLLDVIAGKRVVVIDDSIVRSTTAGHLVDLLWQAGAIEVHVLITSPPVKFPDYYGIDTPVQKKLAAATMTVEEIRQAIHATSLHYLSYEGLIAATGLPEDVFCTSCFTGEYPIDIGKHSEGIIFQR
jgi:amidophosphoribosyltransferase